MPTSYRCPGQLARHRSRARASRPDECRATWLKAPFVHALRLARPMLDDGSSRCASNPEEGQRENAEAGTAHPARSLGGQHGDADTGRRLHRPAVPNGRPEHLLSAPARSPPEPPRSGKTWSSVCSSRWPAHRRRIQLPALRVPPAPRSGLSLNHGPPRLRGNRH